jgi:cytidylate kinase
LGSRLAIWLLREEAITVYFDANIDKRVSNIKKREPEKSEKEIREFTAQRDVADHQRFLKLYQINNDDFSFADVIIDANKEIEKIVEELTNRILKFM